MAEIHGPPLIEFTISGRAAGKKTSPNIIYPGVASLGLQKTPRMMKMAKRAARLRGRRARAGGVIMGLRDLMDYLAQRIEENPRAAALLALKARENVYPSIVPPRTHAKWLKRAMPVLEGLRCSKPIVPEGHMVRVDCIVYMETGQTGDLINFEEALWDALQEAQIIPTDHWINGHGGSERRWTDPTNPRMEVAIFDLGPKAEFVLPRVQVRGLNRDGMGPVRFAIRSPDGELVERCSMPRGTTRKKLVLEAMRLWEMHHAESLPEGSVIACGEASRAVQGGLF